MNAQLTRVDVELRAIGIAKVDYYEFQAMNSFGQEFICDELGLRGMGEYKMKLCSKSSANALGVLRRMLADGLNVKQINTELVP